MAKNDIQTATLLPQREAAEILGITEGALAGAYSQRAFPNKPPFPYAERRHGIPVRTLRRLSELIEMRGHLSRFGAQFPATDWGNWFRSGRFDSTYNGDAFEGLTDVSAR